MDINEIKRQEEERLKQLYVKQQQNILKKKQQQKKMKIVLSVCSVLVGLYCVFGVDSVRDWRIGNKSKKIVEAYNENQKSYNMIKASKGIKYL